MISRSLVLAGPHPRSLSLGGAALPRFPPAPRSGRRRCHRLAGSRPTRDRSSVLILLVAAVGFVTVSCEKVPLLAPTSASITLTALATALPINGTTDLLVQVLEQAGTPPHSGTHVTFTATLGTVQPSEAETDINGRVVVKFLAGTASGTATITASSGGAGSSGGSSTTGTGTTATDSRTVKIAIGAAAVDNVSLTASPANVPSAGGSVTLTASANDASGNRLPGVPVTFSTTAGQLSATAVNTDQTGNAVTLLTTSRAADVTATAGSKTSNKVSIVVNVGPPVTLTAPTTAIVVGQPASFTVGFGTPAGSNPVQRVTVDFGDGTSPAILGTTGGSVAHSFNSPGTYTVTATAIDSAGDRGAAISVISVAERPHATVTITASPLSPQTGQAVAITVATTNLPAGATLQNVSVDFGDGATAANLGAQSSVTVQHVYQSPGTYTVTATVRDNTGASSSGSTAIFVTPKPPLTVGLTTSTSGSVVTFTATPCTLSTGVFVDHYEWTFGDGTAVRSSSSTTTTHVYAAGTYTASVTLVASDGTRASATVEIKVT